MKTMKVTQSENIQKILDERKWMKEYKEAYEKMIEKWNSNSWKWIPPNFEKDWRKLKTIEDNQFNSYDTDHPEYFKRCVIHKKTLNIFLELEKTITNPYFFWSLVGTEFSISDFHQSVLLEWIEAFTRYGRLENTTLEQRQKCVENMKELNTNKDIP